MREERYDTPEPIRLNLEVPAGRIRVEAADTTETELTLEPLNDSDGSRAAVENARIEFRDGELVVEVPDQRTFGISFGRRTEVGLRVRCPQGSRATVKSRSADVEGRGRYTDAYVATSSGDVEWDEVEGEATFNSVSGDLRVGTVVGRLTLHTVSGDATLGRGGGPVRAQTISGDLVLREANGPVTAKTVSGDLELESVEAGLVDVNSVSGDLRVGIKRGSRLAVDATAVSGDLQSDIELAGEGPGGDGPLVELRARTVSGDLRVTRA